MRLPRLVLVASLFMLVLSLPGWPAHRVQGTSQQVATVQVSPLETCCKLVNSIFSVNVLLILPVGEQINGFDVRINYTKAFTTSNPGVLRAVSLTYSNNVFSSSGTVLVDCIDDIAQQGANGCPPDDSSVPGQVHFVEGITGQTLPGPVSGGLLFTIGFQVKGTGSSIISVDRANLVNPTPDPSNPQLINPVFIPALKQDAVFGNNGVVSFFNFQTSDTSITPSIIPNHAVSFDASGSFLGNGSSVSFRLYSWDFGDGSVASNLPGPTNSHIFNAPGNYTVSLTVSDQKNENGTVTRKVNVLPALGNLSLKVEDERGTVMRGNVVVRVFNSSSFTTPFVKKTVNQDGSIQFNALAPSDNYYLTFSGDTVDNFSKTESVLPGWTSLDTVFLPLKQPPPDYSGIIYLGTILGGLGVVAGAIIYKKRNLKARSSGHSSRRAKVRK
jgi:PKD domain-containing protein